jgi:hypothetical protein
VAVGVRSETRDLASSYQTAAYHRVQGNRKELNDLLPRQKKNIGISFIIHKFGKRMDGIPIKFYR